MSENAEFDRMLSRFLDGSATADELSALENRLIADDAFAEHFARWCLAHRQITELLDESKLHRLMDQFVTSAPGLPKEVLRSRSRPVEVTLYDSNADEHDVRGAARREARQRFWVSAPKVAIAASMVGIAAVVWIIADPRSADNKSASSGAQSNQQNTTTEDGRSNVATLTQVVNGAWAKDATAFWPGQQLAEGSRIALTSGMAKVTFDCGAEVALQGPCDFVVQGSMVGVLRSGRITANVPRRAFSFAILSPNVDFVDLGTSFGVAVEDNARTELHVFEGEVLCSPSKKRNGERNEVIHVSANNAVEFGSQSQLPSDIAMDETQFARLFSLRRTHGIESGRLTTDEMALWLAADVAVTTDDKDGVVSWQDIVYDDNQSAEDAVQADVNARPLLVESAINGRPAIRFDGESDFLLTTPLQTTDDQTVLLVCQYSRSAFDPKRRWGGQILNYDGPPSRYLSDTLEPGVLQIGEPLLAEQFKPSLVTGQVFAGFIGSAVVESGRVDAKPLGADTPVVVAFVYDYEYENGKSFLEINGLRYGEARAFAPQGITSRKIIGRHAWMQNFFHGDLAELVIFNKALTEEELAQSTAYLADKYGITLER